MILKYDKYGTPYQEPPYSEEELREIERTLYGPPIAIVRGPRGSPPSAGPEQPPAGSPPASEPPPAGRSTRGPRQ